MPKPPLSMKPTGWFQVAWAAQIAVGAVHRMTYFGREMVAWRAHSGELAVMDAYCEHLGAHLGHGGHVEGDRIVCPFHGWEWNREGRNVCIPYENRPNPLRRIRSYPVVERNESVYIWHDIQGREPYFDVPDVFTGFESGGDVSDYHPAATLLRERLQIHPQYVLENGVDFAHFKYVHKTPFIPTFTRQEFVNPISYVDFTIAFDEVASADEMNSGVEAINGGLGVAVTKSWGMIDNRTITAVTPVDDATADVRFMVYIGRGQDASTAKVFAQAVIDQFLADVHIWQHQRYSDPPTLVRAEYEGFMKLRQWATQFYPEEVTA
ncbi:Rieske 2Fe-2S domain-containing protein [Mycobacterium sp. CBMA271]|uniref:Rieske 2Fe-2S domain-containing protein n=1 Tax=unclassified Mycobacteroides TaxID=2618759 RepID=UPI0012DD3F8D|nr:MULTISPECIES: Rieske 2Fe-2S domain-containing protein [unclassified Mycobacteroides]MUM15809.1 2Fe-2S ferredoxin [Mycobacteroides sp. CBMA 326]MUM24418.1 Rieske 2Fe-2S domain-containing protein [Mycobacteroides sp. CBMA 271]